MDQLKVAELCAGYGGLAMGLTMAGIDHTVEWFAETDTYATEVMQAHHPDAPNMGDLTRIDGDLKPVDMVTAGFP